MIPNKILVNIILNQSLSTVLENQLKEKTNKNKINIKYSKILS